LPTRLKSKYLNITVGILHFLKIKYLLNQSITNKTLLNNINFLKKIKM